MPIPKPNSGESQSDFMQRCMADDKMISEYDKEQRAAVCQSNYVAKLAGEKISFDYDGTFSTQKGFDRAVSLIESGADVYIISARGEKDGMLPRANKAGILFSRVYAMGSNKAKVEKVKELNISVHYDNNQEVVNQLPNVGRLFT
jgi:hypothetical protein